MANTFNKDVEKGKQTWWLEHASLVLRYERLLWESQVKKYRCGIFIENKSRHGDGKTPRQSVGHSDHSDAEFYLVRVRSKDEEERERNEWMHELVPAMAQALENNRFQVCMYVRDG